jgi:hypothetical protein
MARAAKTGGEGSTSITLKSCSGEHRLVPHHDSWVRPFHHRKAGRNESCQILPRVYGADVGFESVGGAARVVHVEAAGLEKRVSLLWRLGVNEGLVLHVARGSQGAMAML